MRITYTARRKLVSGHTAATSYDIAVVAADLLPDLDIERNETESLSGKVESNLSRLKDMWRVETDYIEIGDDLDEFTEFLASVANGETFTFDPDSDDVGTAVSPTTVMLSGRSQWRKRRVGPRHFTFTFDVREA